jgi:hypothetical protein
VAGGVTGPYLLRASSPQGASAGPAPPPDVAAPSAQQRRSVAVEFDAMLRERERELAANPLTRLAPMAAPGQPVAAPPLGDVRSFKACGNLGCSSFITVEATARFVGSKVAVYIDNQVPQTDPLQDSDAAELGLAFDNFHYPIDTTAFGRESDLDGNGVVIVLMTDAVNGLTPDCTNGRVVGYFFGGDLRAGPNSNNGEVFFTLVPAPPTATCPGIGRHTAVDNLKPTLIHEFQHMISFNQHALLRSGDSEETWVNEGLSHIAEELAGRLIPNSECTPNFPSCRSQYSSGNLTNGYDYLKNTEGQFLIFPSGSQGTLGERGAAWLFLRWVLDQFAADTILGAPTTRALVQTSLTGAANVANVTGVGLQTMVPQWLMAAYLDDGTALPEEPTGRLRYKSWGLRSIYTDPRNQTTAVPPGPFSGFPIVPPPITGTFSRAGTLRGGSGRHFLIVQSGSGPPIDIQVLRSTTGAQLDAGLIPRFGLVRIR